MSTLIQETQETKTQKMLDLWFEDIIGKLRADQTDIMLGTASPEKEKFYENFVTQRKENILNDSRKVVNMEFIEQALALYSRKLKEYDSNPKKVALNLADAKIYILAIINNNDEKAEDALLLSEAYINHEFEKYGVHLSTTILEEEDNYTIPSHYITYIG